LNVAIEEMRGAEVVPLETGDRELGDEALSLAILTYGPFLQLAEKSVKHGLSERIIKLVWPVLRNADDA